MNTLIDNHETGRSTLQHRLNSQQEDDTLGSGRAYDDPGPSEPSQARELTLGTATILAMFFGLAILCAAFFAFGYSLGTRHNPPPAAIAAAPVTAPIIGGAKPSPGSPFSPRTSAAPAAQPAESSTVPSTPTTVVVKPTPAPAHPPAEASEAPVTPASSALAGSIVQVAAVSHQEDADLIASTLKRRGYAVVIRNEPQDKLLHLQLGPFPNRKDAEAMRQRLLADGFNAYIK